MTSPASLALLVAGLLLPVALFAVLRLRTRVPALAAAAVAIFVGWVCNVAWAVTSTAPGASQGTDDYVSIATNFGWFCPAALVGLTWLVLRFVANRRTGPGRS